MPYKRILVPVDGSEPANAALAEAIRVARATGGELRLLHVVEQQILSSMPDAAMLTNQLVEALEAAGNELLRGGAQEAANAGVGADSVRVEGRARRVSEVIVEQAAAWPADLVVMGTHGRRGLDHLLLGSDAERVARSVSVPLLLVRAPHRAQHGS
jgi:nucleotide-binding universal stress UspA family protein